MPFPSKPKHSLLPTPSASIASQNFFSSTSRSVQRNPKSIQPMMGHLNDRLQRQEQHRSPIRSMLDSPHLNKSEKEEKDDHIPEVLDHQLADLTVLVFHIDLYDSGYSADEFQQQLCSNSDHSAPSLSQQQQIVQPYHYYFPTHSTSISLDQESQLSSARSIAVYHLPYTETATSADSPWLQMMRCDQTKMSTAFDNNTSCLTKYWKQRRRLFSRFDAGIQLDEEGWFSVTPEQIADHVAKRFQQLIINKINVDNLAGPVISFLVDKNEYFIVDAFCGCGGNSIAFAKLPNVTVIAVDIDRSKLRMAAHNASIYNIQSSKIVFVECNVLFLLEHVYQNGSLTLDQPFSSPEAAVALMNAMPPPVQGEVVDGFQIGGIDLLPRTIDAVFMDPPWGGVDYEVFGKNGYDLQRNMKIQRPKSVSTKSSHQPPQHKDGALDHSFFDSFQSAPRTKEERKAQFNCGLDEANCVDGAELLALASSATQTHWVIYDVPRNINIESLGQAALAAGYRGNVKLEEHYLNSRLKTVTAYLGSDWSELLRQKDMNDSSIDNINLDGTLASSCVNDKTSQT